MSDIDKMSPEDLEQILLQIADGDEVMAIELASKRSVFTNCCTYNYTSIGETDDNPYGKKKPPPKPKPPPPDEK